MAHGKHRGHMGRGAQRAYGLCVCHEATVADMAQSPYLPRLGSGMKVSTAA